MSGALDALRAAMATGDVDALARTYARNAVLQASLPGGRVRRDGRRGDRGRAGRVVGRARARSASGARANGRPARR